MSMLPVKIQLVSMQGRIFTIVLLLIAITVYGQTQMDTIQLADPTIFYDKGTYYLYGTGNPDGFLVYTSANLTNWQLQQRNALLKGDCYGTKGFWAPQVFKHNGKYYMAYTANEHIAIAESDSPLGPFTQQIHKPIAEGGKQIDPFVFKDTDGTLYLYHVRLQEGNRIYVARLNAELNGIDESTAIECLHAEEGWENTANAKWPVSEGPTVIKIGALYYLVYSANDFRNISYAVGYAVAPSPTGPWTKFSANPILSRANTGKSGTGHGDIFKAKNGKFYYVFHTHNSDHKVDKRKTAIVQLLFSKHHPVHISAVPGSFRYLEIATGAGLSK